MVERIDIDPIPIAFKLWQQTRLSGEAETELTAALNEARSIKAATTSDLVTDVLDPKRLLPN